MLKEAIHSIGALNCYRKFVKNYLEIAAPIQVGTTKSKLRRKDFHWGLAQSHLQPWVLGFPNANSLLAYILSIDASDIVWAPLFSKTLHPVQVVFAIFLKCSLHLSENTRSSIEKC